MNRYDVIDVLGEGAFGDVFKARDKSTGELVAIKRFKDGNDEALAKRELQTHCMVSDPHVVECRDGFRHAGLLHIVFEFAPGGDLLGVISKHPRGVGVARARRYMYDLVRALHCCQLCPPTPHWPRQVSGSVVSNAP